MTEDLPLVAVEPGGGVRPLTVGRLSVTGSVYFQPADGGEPTADGEAWSRPLDTDEQPYRREQKVGEDWTELDCGWLDRAGYLRVANRGRRSIAVQPTEYERADLATAVLEVGVAVPDGSAVVAVAVVVPGEDCRFAPADAGSVRLRCRRGVTRAAVAVYPA